MRGEDNDTRKLTAEDKAAAAAVIEAATKAAESGATSAPTRNWSEVSRLQEGFDVGRRRLDVAIYYERAIEQELAEVFPDELDSVGEIVDDLIATLNAIVAAVSPKTEV